MSWLEQLVQIPNKELLDYAPPEDDREQALNINTDANETLEGLVDNVLSSLDKIIERSLEFETDIAKLSRDMAELESLSSSLHNRLEVREKVLAKLEPALSEWALPPTIVDEIWKGEIGPQWRASLALLEKSRISNANTNASSKLHDEATRLRRALLARAAERSKTFWVAHLRTLRKPGVDAQSVQAELISNAALFQFLQARVSRLAQALKTAYINTMSWYYTTLFGKYGRWVSRQPLQYTVFQPLGSTVPDASSRGFFSSKSSSTASSESWSIGARPSVLMETSAIPITHSSYVAATPAALSDQQPHHAEVWTKSLLIALSNSVSIEDELQNTVFGEDETQVVFENVFTQYSSLISKWIQDSSDAFALLIIIRLLQKHCTLPAFQQFRDSLLKSGWTRINTVLGEHASSIEAAASKLSSRTSQATGGPHVLTQMCSSFLSGLLQLCQSDEAVDEPIAEGIRKVAEAYELFITKLSTDENVRYTNYFMVSALLTDVPGRLAESVASHFKLLEEAYSRK